MRVVLWNQTLQYHLHLVERGICIPEDFLNVYFRNVNVLALRGELYLVCFRDLRLDCVILLRGGSRKFLKFPFVTVLRKRGRRHIEGVSSLVSMRHVRIHEHLQGACVTHSRLGKFKCIWVLGHGFKTICFKKVLKAPQSCQISSSLLQGHWEVTRVVDGPAHLRFGLLRGQK